MSASASASRCKASTRSVADIDPSPRVRLEQQLAVRHTTPLDREFLLGLYAQTRDDELAITGWTDEQRREFIHFQFTVQDADYHARYPDASFDLVLLDGEPVGRLYTDRTPAAIHVIDITMAQSWQRRGLGTGLLLRIMDEAVATSCPITLHAEIGSPAQAWYERLGFVADGQHGPRVHMRWQPPDGGSQAKTAS